MPKFTVRVELHGASEAQYDELHEAMEAEGFVRWIKAAGQKYQLPTAEYNLPGSTLTKYHVLNRARRAAQSVKPTPTPWILVTKSAGRTWDGLEPWHG
jgi:hypothetical protein